MDGCTGPRASSRSVRQGLGRLAGACAGHPRRTILIWLLVALAGGMCLPALQDRLGNGGFVVDDSESGEVRRAIDDRFPAQAAAVQVVVAKGPETAAATRRVARGLRGTPLVRATETLSPGDDQRPGVVGLVLRGTSDDATEALPELRAAARELARPAAVHLGGQPAYFGDTTRETREDLAAAERFALPLTLAVLVLAFGSLAAAALPVVTGVAGLGLAFAALLALTYGLTVQVFVINLAALVGLGVGVDYALLMVTRIRAELRAGRDPVAAAAVAGMTAGHAVLTSGMAVVLALAGLFAIGIPSFDGMAVGTMLTVVCVMSAALTLLPAASAALAGPLARGRGAAAPSAPASGVVSRVADVVVRRPVVSSAVAVATLLVLSSPALGLRLGLPGPELLPSTSGARIAAAEVDAALGQGSLSPVIALVPPGPAAPGEARRLAALAHSLPGVGSVRSFVTDRSLRDESGGGLVLAVVRARPESAQARDVVRRLRDAAAGGARIGGLPAERVDEVERYADRLPFAVLWVLGTAALTILVAFRSLLLPIKAVAATLLSAGAALGVVVWVFQQGHLADVLGFQQIDGVPAFLPILLFPIVFGLSMDYEVFLLSSIDEERRAGAPDREAIRRGVRRTARTITGAAAVMISVAAGFAATDLLPTQAMGFGICVAVLLDATLVRLVLVPALLAVLGRAAWGWPTARVRPAVNDRPA